MSYKTIPWTTTEEPTSVRVKKQEIQLKELKKKSGESLPISVARVVKFLNKNKNKNYTNAQIAESVGLSGSTVSGIMDKLEEIGCVKVTKIRKGLTSGISQVYQSYDGSSAKVEKEREAEGYIAKVLAVFEKNINKVYSTKQISETLGINKNKVSHAVSILLATDKIKLVDKMKSENKKELLVYQHIKGNRIRIPVAKESDENYITFEGYLKMNGIKKCPDELKRKIAKGEEGCCRLFQSTKSIIKEYKISYLQEVINCDKTKEEKKGLFERIKVW